MSKTARISFSMEFGDNFSDEDIEEWLRFQLGDRGNCSLSEVYQEYGDLEPIMVEIDL